MTLQRLETNSRMSQAVIVSGLVFLAGQVAGDTSQDVTSQTRQVLAEIDRLLKLADTDKSKLVSATVYLKSMNDFGAMNAVWDAWVVADATPARATVEAKLAGPQYLVEIQIVAAL